MYKRCIVSAFMLAMMVLFGCGGDYNGPKMGGAANPIIDTTPPTVASTSPTSGATNVGTTATISVTFSEMVNPFTVIAGATFTLAAGGTPVSGTISWFGLSTAIFTYSGSLTPGTTYTATITSGVTDRSGNALAAPYTWSFTTAAAADITPPTVLSTIPADGATNVSIKTNISVLFSEPLVASTVTTANFRVTAGSSIAGNVLYTHPTATFTPTLALSSGTTYSFTLTSGITDLAGNPLSTPFKTFTTAPTPSITTTSLNSATENGFYTQTLAVNGGVASYTWSTSSSLPNNLTLSAGGVLSGTPQTGTQGTYPVNVTVTDGDGLTATRSFSLDVFAIPLITTTSLPDAYENVTYNQAISAGGGSLSYISWTAAGLPSGLNFDTATGAISSAPNLSTAGTYSVDFTVTDSNFLTSPIKNLTLNVYTVPSVTTLQAALDAAPAVVGSPYTFNMNAGGGAGSLSWNAIGLPGSLSINTATGAITGTPVSGDESLSPYAVGFTVTDANFVTSPTTTLSLTVTTAPVISTTTLPAATTTGVYSAVTLTATGGTTPYSWSATSLPAGLSLTTVGVDGVLSSPTITAAPGNVSFTVTLTDNMGLTATQLLTLIVNDVPTITTVQADLDATPATNGSPYFFAMSSFGGTAPLTWAAVTLPPNLNINPATGEITGTPAAAGTYSVDFTVTDIYSVSSSTVTLSITVN